MTFSEFNTLAKAMKAMWTDPKFLPDSFTMELWFKLLADLDYGTVSMAVEEIMMTSKFAPTVADIRAAVAKRSPEMRKIIGKTPDEAWSDVMKALRNSIYGYAEEWTKLDFATQRAIGSPEMLRSMAMDEDFNLGVAKSNFIRSYKAVTDRQESNAALPDRMRIENILKENKIPVYHNKELIGEIHK